MDSEALRSRASALRPTPEMLASQQMFRARIFKTCFTLLVLTFIFRTIAAWFKLRHIKGPRLASFSNLWQLKKSLSGNLSSELGQACDEYGPVVRVGPDSVITSDTEALRRMWSARSPYRRSDFYTAIRFDPTKDNLLTQRNDRLHGLLKAKMAAGYSGKENENLEKSIDNQIDGLVHLIDTKYISSSSEYKPMDLARKIQFFAMDAITALAFGTPLGCLETDSDVHSWIKTVEEMLPAMVFVVCLPWLCWFLRTSIVKKFLLPSDKDPTGMGKVINIAKAAVAERFGSDKEDRRDMMGSFIRNGLTQEELESESLLQIIAGSDTTATGIRGTLLYLITSRDIYGKLRAEIDAASISYPIQDSEARSLKYLQACIREGLRIWPPATAQGFKLVPPGGDTIAGVFIPAGTKVGSSIYSVMREKKIFGEDAEVFRPERWLEADESKREAMERQLDMLFSPGKWMCLGKNVAWLELNKVFVELIRRYDIGLINPARPWKSFNSGLHVQSEMWVRITKRERKA